MTLSPTTCMVLFVSDVPKMTRFYRTIASMQMLHEEAGYAVLKIEGFELVIHAMHTHSTDNTSGHGIPKIREDAYTKLCLPVKSLATARQQANELGGAIKTREYEWVARGFRACDGHDPEGNVIQVRVSDIAEN